jgi:hypothetical protein
MSFKNGSLRLNNLPVHTTKAGRKSKKTKRFVSTDSPPTTVLKLQDQIKVENHDIPSAFETAIQLPFLFIFVFIINTFLLTPHKGDMSYKTTNNSTKHTKTGVLLPSQHKPGLPSTDKATLNTHHDKTIKRVQITDKSLRHDKDKAHTQSQVLVSSPHENESNTANDSYTRRSQSEVDGRSFHIPGPPCDDNNIKKDADIHTHK